MPLAKYAGTGTTLSSNFYMRKFYTSNLDARTHAKRSAFNNSDLSMADGIALRRAVKKLGDFDYISDQDANIRNSVLAYISTYNNTLSSASDSTDRALNRAAKQLKSLTSEYASDLDKIGITVNEDGSLTSRESLFKSASLEKFKNLFSSNSTFMQRNATYGKRIEQRSRALSFSEQQQKLQQKEPSNNLASETTSAAITQFLAESAGFEQLLPDGVGHSINISL